jgi:hypothetical protein
VPATTSTLGSIIVGDNLVVDGDGVISATAQLPLVSSTAPMSPTTGTLWYSTIDGQLYIGYGSVWVQVV